MSDCTNECLRLYNADHYPTECPWIFANIRVWPRIEGGTIVEWIMHPRFVDPFPHSFQLQVGYTSSNTATDWTNVGLPVVNSCYAVDSTKRVYGKFQWTHYRVVVSTPSGIYVSKPQSCFGILDRRDWLLVRDILRREQLRLMKCAGSPGFLLKNKAYGEHCSCLDDQTQDIRNAQHELCYGTGVVGGFYEPIPNVWAELSLAKNDPHPDESRGTVNDVTVVQLRMLNVPQVFHEDVWVDATTDMRWTIHGVVSLAEARTTPVVVSAEAKLLPFTHPIYKFPVPSIAFN